MSEALALLLFEAFVKYGPEAVRKGIAIFEKKTFTKQEWEDLATITRPTYEDYFRPVVAPPASTTGTPLPPMPVNT